MGNGGGKEKEGNLKVIFPEEDEVADEIRNWWDRSGSDRTL